MPHSARITTVKLAWRQRRSSTELGSVAELRPSITLLPGDNRIVVAARDDQGIRWRRSFGIRGEITQAATADTTDADPAWAEE